MPHRPQLFVPAALALLFASASADAQSRPTRPAPRNTPLATALTSIKSTNTWTIDQQISICEIPAPPFTETARAEEFRKRLSSLGLTNVRIDSVGNVIGERPGTQPRGPNAQTVALTGHLDTVFPIETDITVKHVGDTLKGPGIVDDCRGLAVLLSVAKALNDANVRTPGTIYFVGTVGEEGPGNLRGVRHLIDHELKGKVDHFISVDGGGFGVVHQAVGSHRYRVSVIGPGGHSYGAFGMPNPIHALGRAIAKIGDVQVPRTPKTTFSVGIIEGGTSVNSIADTASFDLDMRSESPEALAVVDAQVQQLLAQAVAEEQARWPASQVKLALKVDTIGIRPAGSQPDTLRIVRVARETATRLGQTISLRASSTDANIPMARGIPSITIGGGGSSGGAHSLGEWYLDGPNGYLGPQWAALIVTSLAGLR